jgi:exonuclease I
MKKYTIVVSIIALIAVVCAIYFYSQFAVLKKNAEIKKEEVNLCQKDKRDLENKLNNIYTQVNVASQLAEIDKIVLSGFMTAGDLKAIAIDNKIATEIDEKINNLSDPMMRMRMEAEWSDFKISKKLNPLFGLLRALADDFGRNVSLRDLDKVK